MKLIFFLGLIAKITLAFNVCENGTQDVVNFDWSKVRFGVLTRLLEQEVFKIAARLYISFVVSLRVTQ